jgi:elongator complex protein 2
MFESPYNYVKTLN